MGAWRRACRRIGTLEVLISVTHRGVDIKVGIKIGIKEFSIIFKGHIKVMLMCRVGGWRVDTIKIIIHGVNVVLTHSPFGWTTTTVWCVFGNPSFLEIIINGSIF